MNLRLASRKDFRLEQLLGVGQSSQVYLATAPDTTKVALKLPLREVRVKDSFDRFGAEIALHLSVSHLYIVRAIAGRPSGDDAFLALEFFPKGSLEELLSKGKMERSEGIKCLSHITQALMFLHERGVVHQDVKPSNVFVGEGVYKLGDLGVAKTRDNPRPLERAGSPFYMAPELFAGESSSPASDTYSLGVMAFEVLVGRRPFWGETYEELAYGHMHRPPPLANAPKEYGPILRGLLHKDPKLRATLKQLLEFLQNPTPNPAIPSKATPKSKPAKKGLFGWFKRKD